MLHSLKKLSHYKVRLFSIFWCALVVGIIFAANVGKLGWAYQLAEIIPLFDKLGHAFLFGMLSLSAGIAMPVQRNFIANRRLPVGSYLVLVFAVIEEFSQLFLSHRNFDLMDLLVNVVTIIVTGLLVAKTTS